MISSKGFAQSADTVDVSSIQINKITNSSILKDLVESFGQPDTIFDGNFECGYYSLDWQPELKSVKVVRYSGLEFYLVNDTVQFQQVIFSKLKEQVKITADNFTFTNKTTLEELNVAFPNSYLNYIKEGGNTLRILPCGFCDGELRVIVEDGVLIAIEYWTPC